MGFTCYTKITTPPTVLIALTSFIAQIKATEKCYNLMYLIFEFVPVVHNFEKGLKIFVFLV
jgi:hypothetical protein